MTNRYPIYIVSKGRAHNILTSRALNEIGAEHYIVVEDFEADLYRRSQKVFGQVITLPARYKFEYDHCDKLGLSKSSGPGPARNFCMDHAFSNGHIKHWVMDDNIDAFHYLNRNEKHEVRTVATICAAEDFVDRYANVPVSGFNYYSFAKKTDALAPFVVNTRIYSCLLIDRSFGYRWRGRYNEDTDLSLRVLKDGLCTIQFNAFLCGKVTTQRMRGGNSEEFYDTEGTFLKSKMIVDLHPDVARLAKKFNRDHHHVDYSSFKKNRLSRVVDTSELRKVENYGLYLADLNNKDVKNERD